MRSLDFQPSTRLGSLLLILMILVVFSDVGTFEFVAIDDSTYVTQNRWVQSGLSVSNTIWAFTTMRGEHYHPLVWLSLMLDAQLYGNWAGGYHLTNLVLHCLSSILLFLLWTRLSGAVGKSFVIAALFAVHPVHVESVAWITERKDCLSTFFAMFTMYSYVQSIHCPRMSTRFWTAMAFTACLLSKAMFVTLPFLLMLIDYWPLGTLNVMPLRSEKSCSNAQFQATWRALCSFAGVGRALIRSKSELLVLSLIFAAMTYIAQAPNHSGRPALLELTLYERTANAIISYASYLKIAAVPTGLAVFYPHPGSDVSIAGVVAASLFLIAVTLTALRLKDQYPFLLTGWLWFVIGLAPVIGLVRIADFHIADRYLYTPIIGLFVIVVWGIESCFNSILRSAISGRVCRAVATMTLVCAMYGSHAQARVWQNSEVLFRHAERVTQNNPHIHHWLGVVCLADGRVSEAILEFERSINAGPWYQYSWRQLGAALELRYGLELATIKFETEVESNPDYLYPKMLLLELQLRSAEVAWNARNTQKALALLRSASPRVFELPVTGGPFFIIRNNLASAYQELGSRIAVEGDLNLAAECFRSAIQHNPDRAESHYNLGLAAAKLGLLGEAISAFEVALRINPSLGPAHHGLAQVLEFQGRRAEARRHFQKAEQLRVAVQPQSLR